MLQFGEHAMTNGLVKYDDIKHIDINALFMKREERELPKNIAMKNGLFRVRIHYKKTLYEFMLKTLEEAVKKLDEYKREIEEIKKKEREKHFAKPIQRNDKNRAILLIKNKNSEVIDEVEVDDDRWHELSQYSWSKISKEANYYSTYINGKKIMLHRYLTNAKKGEIIDHINDDDNDVKVNRLDNLRMNTWSGNGHNRKKSKNATSQYFGVFFYKKQKKWRAAIKKDGVSNFIGDFRDEKEAALAYNEKAKELYGDKANLNIFD